MPIKIFQIRCACPTNQTKNFGESERENRSYFYRLQDGAEVLARVALCWCYKCEGLTEFENYKNTEYVPDHVYVENRIHELENRINPISERRDPFWFASGRLEKRQELEKIKRNLEDAEALKTVLATRQSPLTCLWCQDSDIKTFDNNFFDKEDTDRLIGVIHGKCKTEVKIRYSWAWVSFRACPIFLDPHGKAIIPVALNKEV